MRYFLAIDIGASGGRCMLGHLENGIMSYEEVHRFSNGMVKKDGELCWDPDALLTEILHGMKRCAQLGRTPESVGVDTWGVDFVLLDEKNNILGNTVAYRDTRTDDIDAEVYEHISEDELYSRTGIQKQLFNTVYQLMAVKRDARQYLAHAKKLLLIPDYLHYRLSGVAKTEYTNATTTGLINTATKTWDDTIIETCGYPREIFADIVPPGTVLGCLTPEIQEIVGYACKVVLPATHDTGSAVMSVPSLDENTLYISSGTWSLMGVERLLPDCTPKSRERNFTNEGGYDYRFRYLKNIMGLWMIQSVKKEYRDIYSFTELCTLAEKEAIASVIDCNNKRFFAPNSMIHEIEQACLEGGQQVPKEPSEIAAVVYNSLAVCYRDTVQELEQLTGLTYKSIYIVGGGANADYLNRLTARYTEKTVYAGPSEATAIGNLIAQMIACGEFTDLRAARECVMRSFNISHYR